MTAREHYELVFIASRMGLPIELAGSGEEIKILAAICNACRSGSVSDIWGVHSGGNCLIRHNESEYHCRVRQIQGMVDSQGEYVRRFDNSTTPFERDFLVFVLAKRTNELRFTAEDHLGMVLTCCGLCRQGIRAEVDPTIHNHGDCSGSYIESEGRHPGNLEKQCWVHRFWYWCHDPTRMERNYELV